MLLSQRSRFGGVLQGRYKKVETTRKIIGCTPEELVIHIESQFIEGMTWQNYGEWEVDHIIPCASFDFSDPEQQRKCFHYTNLQPLWEKDNIIKSDSYVTLEVDLC